MPRLHRHTYSGWGTTLLVALLALSTSSPPAAAAKPARAAPMLLPDILSGTWQVSRTCLTLCVSPPPVLKVVHHLSGDVYATANRPPQLLYLLGRQVLVHGPTDSLLLTIRIPGHLMSGAGVGATGSTFTTAWRCLAPHGAATAVPGGAEARPARAPRAIVVC